ncbi:VOC family protein [Novosphingobium profundi]|uniref:VOC family protein n=1 Tax=Novosphingobium profundi TaxID=1774954 RepID=UPI001BD95913|nr:VOC family protein [Novosphingobium profundi]MBT0670945.1 VOC family protein [Novosphingobium profundi]
MSQVAPPRECLGYGQPVGGVVQTAFVVEDLAAAIERQIADCGAGPFFRLDHFLRPGQVYRGAPSRADIALAMGFAGHMLIELIQPLDEHPSVYREAIARRGYGFHHFGVGARDVDEAARAYRARGFVEAFRAEVPTGGEVIYLDGGNGAQDGFIELIPVSAGMDAHFTAMWRASLDWDGRDQVRPFL